MPVSTVSPGAAIHVRKLRPDGSQAFAWEGTVLRCDAEGIVVRAAFNLPLVDLGCTTFRQGDVFVEFYGWERWYNVFQVARPDGTLKGWYCNVGVPPTLDMPKRELSYVDLALDVWVNPDGTHQVLDEDELEALVRSGACSAEQARGAQAGRDALLALVQARALPRWP